MARRVRRPRRSVGGIEQIPGKPGYYLAFRRNGKTVRRKASNSHLKARHMLEDMRAMFDDGVELDDILAEVFGDRRGSALTFRDIAGLYKERPVVRDRKPRTMQNEVTRIDGLRKAEWTSVPIKRLRRATVLRWRDRRLKRVSPSTANRDLGMARCILNWAVEREYCATNPLAGIKPLSEKGRARDVYLTVEECRALIEACSEDIRLIVVMAIRTGMRRGEILSLRWTDVSPDYRHVDVRKDTAKSLRPRRLMLGHTVRRGLAEWAEQSKSTPRQSCATMFSLSPDQLRTRFDKARFSCEAISMEKRKALCFHALRHTAASLMRQGGTSLGDLMAILGHGSYSMVLRYSHLGPDVGADAAERLEAAFEGGADDAASTSA